MKEQRRVETFPNEYPDRRYTIEIVNEEYTSVCPRTGLPDFGRIIIRYVPDKKVLELKALKFYFLQYRNMGIFYEHAVNRILDDLVASCEPHEMEVIGEFSTRGGMHSRVVVRYEKGEAERG
ncbi:MAG TPA: NADPH-dependent 7-cyano-7-deazaguanine reductase QueF [Bacteroidetes bacterium]|nr:NADPH-dependent 7-cyano-7-deazaguanine reductase QueF [Bacteroidota bacterium]